MHAFPVIALLSVIPVASAAGHLPAMAVVSEHPGTSASKSSNMSVHDLLALRDIGDDEMTAISVSPSGRLVAFQLEETDFAANTYRSAWYVVATSAHGEARRIASGGEVQFARVAFGRLDGRQVVSARWSPDERWIAYL